MKERIENSPAKERFSSDFRNQIIEHGNRKYGHYFNKNTDRYDDVNYNPFEILDKVEELEKSAFGKRLYKPLNNFGIENLFHVHHIQAINIAKNCLNELKRRAGSLNMPSDEYEELAYDTLFLYYYVIEKCDEITAYDRALGRLSHMHITETYEKKAEEKRLTGDWIVLYRKDSKNYYLTLARHEEPDEHIKERVLKAMKELSLILH